MSQLKQIKNLSPKVKRQSIKNPKGRILVFIAGFSEGLDKLSIYDSLPYGFIIFGLCLQLLACISLFDDSRTDYILYLD